MTQQTSGVRFTSHEWICDVHSLIRMEDPPVAPGTESPPVPVVPPVAPPATPPVDKAAPPAASTGGESQAADWRDRRISTLTARLRELERKQAAAPLAPEPGTATPPAPASPDFETRVAQEAERRAQAKAFDDACGVAAEAGRKQFPDFDLRVSQLRRLADPADVTSVQAYNTFLAAAIETGKGPEIIHRLGGDLNEAGRLLALPPVKMALELAKLAAVAPQAPSATPRPLAPIRGGAGASHEEIDPRDKDRADKLSTAEWMARRTKQVTEQQTVRGRG